jgi:hypothetical protein
MNERIQELIGQAQKEVWGNCPYNGSPEFEGYELDAEKFAELIVEECGKWIVDNAGAIENLGPKYFAQAMIKDFGVDE